MYYPSTEAVYFPLDFYEREATISPYYYKNLSSRSTEPYFSVSRDQMVPCGGESSSLDSNAFIALVFTPGNHKMHY